MKPLPLAGLTVLLASCAPLLTLDTQRLPQATEYGPHQQLIEWWYVSAYLPGEELAFHWAQFRVRPPGTSPVMFAHVAITDLKTGQLEFLERAQSQAPGRVTSAPLNLAQGDWTFVQNDLDPLSPFVLKAAGLDLKLTPAKGPVMHPPGYSGTEETGQLYYQGITRLNLQGVVAGRAVQGQAWFDHQWGNQVAGQSALWDWMSIQMAGGEDLMLYRVKTPTGKAVQTIGSIVDSSGVARAAHNVVMEPGRVWRGTDGRQYVLSWHVKADEFDLSVNAVHDEQELLSRSSRIAYWEGPITVTGIWRGLAQEGHGMMELVVGTLK